MAFRREKKFVDISVLGDEELAARLHSVGVKVQRRIVAGALKRAASVVLRGARQLAPVDTGRLQKSLKIKPLLVRRGSSIFGVRVVTGTRSELRINPEDRYYYPAVLEYGSATVRPFRFMRNAADQHKPAFRAAARKALRDGINEAGL